MLPDVLLEKALQNKVLECKEFSSNLQFCLNLLDESVNWVSVQKFFSKAAWTKVTDMVANLEKNPNWKCGATCIKIFHHLHQLCV